VRIFITYAREDGAAAAQLGADLESSQRQVWIDRELTGGQAWWDEILNQIRECDLYVFALSESSLDSKPCLRELAYAQALGRPLLPIKVGQVSIQQAPRVIADAQVIDYVDRTPDGVLALRDALDAAPQAPALPDPLPEPPAAPISYFGDYREQIGADSLPYTEQQALLLELKNHLGNEDDRGDAADLLAALRRRHDLAQSVATEIDGILTAAAAQAPPPDATPVVLTAPSPMPALAPTPPTKKKRTGLLVGVGIGTVLLFSMALAPTLAGGFDDVDSETISSSIPDTVPNTTISVTVPETTVDVTVPENTIPVTVPEALGCPVIEGEFFLGLPDVQYEPFGDGYLIVWYAVGGFSTFDPYTGLWTDFPDLARDIWHELIDSPFQVCIDSSGTVLGAYAW